MLPIDSLVVASLTQPLCSLPEAVVSPLLLRLILEGCAGSSAMEYIQMIKWEYAILNNFNVKIKFKISKKYSWDL